jgi:hypothetical protein
MIVSPAARKPKSSEPELNDQLIVPAVEAEEMKLQQVPLHQLMVLVEAEEEVQLQTLETTV